MNIPVWPVLGGLLIVGIAGCGNGKPFRNSSQPPSAVRGNSIPLRPLAIPNAKAPPRAMSEEPALLIPPPPQLTALNKGEMTLPMPEIPAPPEQSTALVKATIPRPGALDVETPVNASDRLADLRRIHSAAQASYAKMDSFEARLTRRETIDGKDGPLEVIRFQLRKRPLSIHMKWIGTEGQGRELVFVDGKHDSKIHILTARGDMFPLSPATRMALAPDSDLVRSKARHSIREAGLESSIRQLGKALSAADKNPMLEKRIVFRGLVERPEYSSKLEAVEEIIAPGAESLLPRGGKRMTYYDPSPGSVTQNLPVIVCTRDHTGREVEFYCFDRFIYPIALDDADFDPDRSFKRK